MADNSCGVLILIQRTVTLHCCAALYFYVFPAYQVRASQ